MNNAKNFLKNRKSPKKFRKVEKSPKKAQNFKIAKKPYFFGSFSSGLYKKNFGIHGHFFY